MCAHVDGLSRQRATAWALCGFAVSAPAWGVDGERASVRDDAHARPARSSFRTQRFDIPAQPLATALNRYASASGWPILFRGTTVAGRISSPVQGDYEPEAALHRLLDGTGLAPVKVDAGPPDAYTLKEAEAGSRWAGAPAAGTGVDFEYGAWVQARIWDALCADVQTTPGAWRALLRFRLDADGHVQDARMLSSTGPARRDAAVLAALQRVRMERAPPLAMPQPLTMLVLPFERDGGQRCKSNAAYADDGAAPAHD